MTSGKIQAKHIPAKALIDLVDRLWNAPVMRIDGRGEVDVYYPYGVSFQNICKYWDHIPPKVIQTKLKKLIETNYLDGCYCGCSTGIRVIHESDLPMIRRRVRVGFGEEMVWIEERLPRSMYGLWQSGQLQNAGH